MKTLRIISLLLLAVFTPGPLHAQNPDSFNPSPNGVASNIVLQPDGKILIGGYFWTVNGVTRYHMARIDADGTLDNSFDPNITPGVVLCTILQPDGKIVVGGTFSSVGGVARSQIARLNADGSLDLAFNPYANGTVTCLALQSDGKIIVGGEFTNVGGVTRNRIARLNADGSVDSTFNPNASSGFYALFVQPDGKILVGGYFTALGGVTRNRIARLNSNGTLDSTFNPDANSTVVSLAVQTDGRILIGGHFTAVGGVTRNRMARLNSDGSLDGSFNPNVNDSVETIALHADGRIVIGGYFTTVGGVTRNRIARFNADGTLDTAFNPDANDYVEPIALQADGKILMCGRFTSVGGVARDFCARITNNITATATIAVSGTNQIDWTRGASAPEVEHVTFESWNGSSWVSLGAATRVSGGWRMTGLSLPSSGQIRARGRCYGRYSSSGIIEQVASYAPPVMVSSASPAIGSITGGTSVSITGNGFTGASAVTFGGTPAASFTVNSDTSITATTPARAAGTVDVSVTATAGSGTGTNVFTYYGPPVASFTASPNPVAPNQIISFNGYYSFQSASGGSITAYQWNWGDGSPAGSGATPNHYYPLFGTYQVTLTVTDNFGQTASTTNTVTVNQGNNAPVANAGGPYTIRLGQDLTLDGRASTDVNASQGDSIVSYAWDLDNNGTFGDITGANPTVSWSAIQRVTGTSTIALRVTDSMGATNTATTTLTVNPLPSATTSAASGITTTGATLNGAVNANGTPSSVSFDWGTTTGYGNSIAATPASVSGNTATAVNAALTGLVPHTTYHYRVKASWIDGTSVGNDGSFTTANTSPTFAGYSISTPYQTVASVSLSKLLAKASDADGDALSVTAAGPASAQGGTAVLQSGSILYSPPSAFSGTDTFSVTIADGYGASVSGTVTVTVGPNPTSGGAGVNQPVITTLAGGQIGIASQGIPGRTYMVQRSTNLSAWATIGSVTAASNGTVNFIDPSPPPGSSFYRLGRNVPVMNFWGNGSDGSLTTTGNISFGSVQDGDVVVKQFTNLTINAGHTVTTSTRCRGLVIYVNGDCTINGTLSMTARGANVNPTLANSIPATGIRLARFKYGANETLAASDLGGTGLGGVGAEWRAAEAGQLGIAGTGRIYTIAREGGAGGDAKFNTDLSVRLTGGTGLSIANGTGGGGGGGATGSWSGAGSAGTCFSGGSGGGGACGPGQNNADSGAANGGQGGNGNSNNINVPAGGGAGNPGGAGLVNGSPQGPAGQSGTGGLLLLFVKGNLTLGANGVVSSHGSTGGNNGTGNCLSGGGSGGGRIIILHAGTYVASGIVAANGGSTGANGGMGGSGAVTIDRIDP